MKNDKREPFGLEPIILASGSPRRADLLAAVGWKYTKVVPEIDESEIPGEAAVDYVVRLAEEKSKAIGEQHQDEIVLGADTTVVIDGTIVGKPADRDDARSMIASLSGRWHEVLTGVALTRRGLTVSGVQTTRVKFADMSVEEVEFLVDYGEPMDKAGAYAVQAQAALFIEKIEGDYWNVTGLPVSLVYRLYLKLATRKESIST